MRALALALLLSFVPISAIAETKARPILRVTLSDHAAVPGQAIALDVTILVPTWMPRPPELPSFEIPDVAVRLPEGASMATSETLDGETWSGVMRAYQLYPMVVGRFRIPSLPVTVTFADPDTLEPVEAVLRTNELVFEGVAPVGAEALDPFIAADRLTLEQRIEGDPEGLEPGAAFTRTVTARIEGASPIFLPPLVPRLEAPGLAAYPQEPVFEEKGVRGVVVGKRIERVTYVAEAGARVRTAPVQLQWWNLHAQRIEVAELPPLEIVSSGPPPGASPTASAAEALLRVGLGALLGAVALAGFRSARPRVAGWLRRRREAHVASEAFAFDRVVRALRAHRFGEALRALELWGRRVEPLSPSDLELVSQALTPLSAELYGRRPLSPSGERWSEALRSLRKARERVLARDRARTPRGALPALNPRRNGAGGP